MVSKQSVLKQLKKIGFNPNGWGKGEVNELHTIILPDEEILEVANGFYEGGFAMIVATDVRVLIVDKKPLNYLTVEDLRFDMINEMDYSHRLVGAQINIASGEKKMKFSSLNQQRLRKVINHVQHNMAESKKKHVSHQEDQKSHLEQINQQLQAYLVAQHQQQQQLQRIHEAQASGQPAPPMPEPVKPSPELADYLYAQSLLAQYHTHSQQQVDMPQAPQPTPVQTAQPPQAAPPPIAPAQPEPPESAPAKADNPQNPSIDLYAEGVKEVFGKHDPRQGVTQPVQADGAKPAHPHLLENVLADPMRIAYSKLPMALRNRRFGRPSFHDHSASLKQASEPNSKDSQPAPAPS